MLGNILAIHSYLPLFHVVPCRDFSPPSLYQTSVNIYVAVQRQAHALLGTVQHLHKSTKFRGGFMWKITLHYSLKVYNTYIKWNIILNSTLLIFLLILLMVILQLICKCWAFLVCVQGKEQKHYKIDFSLGWTHIINRQCFESTCLQQKIQIYQSIG